MPYESLKRNSRERKYTIEELQGFLGLVRDIAARDLTDADQLQAVSELITKISQLQDSVMFLITLS